MREARAVSRDIFGALVPYGTPHELKAGETVLIAAHGNSLRAIVKLIYGLSSSEIMDVEVPTGNPLLIELDANLKPTSARDLDEARATALPPIK